MYTAAKAAILFQIMLRHINDAIHEENFPRIVQSRVLSYSSDLLYQYNFIQDCSELDNKNSVNKNADADNKYCVSKVF